MGSNLRAGVARIGVRAAMSLVVLGAVARCGNGEGGSAAPTDGGAAPGGAGPGEGGTVAGPVGGGGTSAGEPVGGASAGEAAGGVLAGGASGVPTCVPGVPGDMKLRLVTYEDESYAVLEYDDEGRLAQVKVGPHQGDFTYAYDDEDRIGNVAHSEHDGYGYYVTYQSGSTRYQDDDMSTSAVELDGRRWLERTHFGSSTRIPTWENGLITQILSQMPSADDTLTEYQYDVDAEGRPVRMVEVGQPEPATLEVYDEADRHLFQVVRAANGTLAGVRLYRDNADPVRSLMAAVEPELLASNAWLWASFDPAGEAGVLGYRRPKPLDLTPWGPLVLDPSERVDFAADLDGDDEEDVRGTFTNDAEGRLARFELELNQSPRVIVDWAYAPELVTETIEYNDDGPAAVVAQRRYHYGCEVVQP